MVNIAPIKMVVLTTLLRGNGWIHAGYPRFHGHVISFMSGLPHHAHVHMFNWCTPERAQTRASVCSHTSWNVLKVAGCCLLRACLSETTVIQHFLSFYPMIPIDDCLNPQNFPFLRMLNHVKSPSLRIYSSLWKKNHSFRWSNRVKSDRIISNLPRFHTLM